MRFTLLEPTALSPHHLLHLARVAEECGFDAIALNDGTFQIRASRGTYPYSADHRPNWDLEAPFYEPLTLLPALAMAVPRLRFVTSVIKLPLHHPLVLAKQVATAAIMSDDRFVLGVGASWAPEEYEYCGVDWATRGTRMTESVEALRLLLLGDWVAYDGADDQLRSRRLPAGTPVVPKILFGGHHDASLRRAARLGDGWIAGPVASFDELGELVRRLLRLVTEAGRDPDRFEVHASPPAGALGLAAYRRLEAMGVTDAVTLPIDAGGELLIDEPTRQRLRGEPVVAALDPAAPYSTEPPSAKVEAVPALRRRGRRLLALTRDGTVRYGRAHVAVRKLRHRRRRRDRVRPWRRDVTGPTDPAGLGQAIADAGLKPADIDGDPAALGLHQQRGDRRQPRDPERALFGDRPHGRGQPGGVAAVGGHGHRHAASPPPCWWPSVGTATRPSGRDRKIGPQRQQAQGPSPR